MVNDRAAFQNPLQHSSANSRQCLGVSKLKHDERDDPADLKLEVSKLINNVSSTAPDFIFDIKQQYTFEEVQTITKNATQNLKTHLMKTLFINKLAPS